MHFTEKEILEGIKKDIPKPNRKIFTLILTVFILLITLFYFLFNPYTLTILAGFTETDIINEENLVISKKGITLQFSQETYSHLKLLFIENEGKEFKACLLGKKEEQAYSINQVLVPLTYSQEFSRVVAAPCPEGTLIDLHSHPQNHCIPSYHDVQVLKNLKKTNPDRIMGVMCNLERFNFYT